LKAAEEVGCTSPIHAQRYDPLTVIKEQTQGKGVDAVLSNLHNPQDIYKALQMVKRGGALALAYGPEGNLAFPFADMCGERRIMPVVGYSEADEALAIDFIGKKRISGKSLITHRFGLEEAEQAFEVSMNKEKHKAILVMIKP
jgi:threonine dehydrogenase-like Zn-dependent dehydrogenase